MRDRAGPRQVDRDGVHRDRDGGDRLRLELRGDQEQGVVAGRRDVLPVQYGGRRLHDRPHLPLLHPRRAAAPALRHARRRWLGDRQRSLPLHHRDHRDGPRPLDLGHRQPSDRLVRAPRSCAAPRAERKADADARQADRMPRPPSGPAHISASCWWQRRRSRSRWSPAHAPRPKRISSGGGSSVSWRSEPACADCGCACPLRR